MGEQLIVGMIVALAALYAVVKCLPAPWRARIAARLASRGPRMARPIGAASGCGSGSGCSSCHACARPAAPATSAQRVIMLRQRWP